MITFEDNDRRRAIAQVLGLTACLLWLGGCASNVLFQATFDADALHSEPNPIPPGPPADDRLVWFPASGGFLSVVLDGALDSNSLRIANVGGRGNRFVSAIPVSVADDASHIYAYWNGVSYISESATTIWLGWSTVNALAHMLLVGDNVKLLTPGGEYETVGTFQNQESHFVLITVDRSASTYDFVFIQGANRIALRDRPVLHPADVDQSRPALHFGYLDAFESTTFYVVDNLTISEKPPPESP